MKQITLPLEDIAIKNLAHPALNKVGYFDTAIHNWYRFVLSFPPHIVREYLLERFKLSPGARVLDPFCGTGTTIVEAKRLGFPGVGIEAHPMAHFASEVKTDWDGNPDKIERLAVKTYDLADLTRRRARKTRKLSDEQMGLLLENSIGTAPLNKVLILQETINTVFPKSLIRYAELCLAKCVVSTASNLHFGPEVGVRGRKLDADVFGAWLTQMRVMADDLRAVQAVGINPETKIYHADARNPGNVLQHKSIAAVFTSPPYPNEKDYTRTTRLESVILGFLTDKKSLRAMKQPLMRSNTRNVYKGDADDAHITPFPQISEIAEEIERKRVELKKDSGFEKLYGRVTKLYFGGMARQLDNLRSALVPGAQLGYVVGDQASYLQVHIPTAKILADIAVHYGYQHTATEVFRTRIATATRRQMEEHVLWLTWPS